MLFKYLVEGTTLLIDSVKNCWYEINGLYILLNFEKNTLPMS